MQRTGIKWLTWPSSRWVSLPGLAFASSFFSFSRPFSPPFTMCVFSLADDGWLWRIGGIQEECPWAGRRERKRKRDRESERERLTRDSCTSLDSKARQRGDAAEAVKAVETIEESKRGTPPIGSDVHMYFYGVFHFNIENLKNWRVHFYTKVRRYFIDSQSF